MSAGNQLTDQHPWPGLPSYDEADSPFFHGRQAETEQLFRSVQRNVLTVVFGPSGTGKTSLVQAGLFPKVRTSAFSAYRIRLDHNRNLVEQVQHALGLTGSTLWEGLHRRQRESSAACVVVLDQFEEIFTLGEGRAESAEFLEQLADAVENYIPSSTRQRLERDPELEFDDDRQNYRIVLVLREEFVARLDGLRRRMPSVMRGRLMIEPFSEKQALEAVEKPGQAVVDRDVAREIVDFASSKARGPRVVDPAILSLLCRELNSRRIGDRISKDQLRGDSETILSDFWERNMIALAEGPSSPVRRFIEDRLVTPDGFRTAAPRSEVGSRGTAVDMLITGRLLRAEERFGSPHLELAHDVLLPVVRKSRIEREGREEAARKGREAAVKLGMARRRLMWGVLTAVGCFLLAAASFVTLQQAKTNEARLNLSNKSFEDANEKLREAYSSLAKSEERQRTLEQERDRLLKAETDKLVQLAQSRKERDRPLLEITSATAVSPLDKTSSVKPSAGPATDPRVRPQPSSCDALLKSGFRRDFTLLTEGDVQKAAQGMDVDVPVLLAVLKVETSGTGFLRDGRPVILFERHLFHSLTGGKFDEDAQISSSQPGGYGPSGAHQYERLARAANLDCSSALQATSWGLSQIIGRHFAGLGYGTVVDFVEDQMASEANQLSTFARFMQNAGLVRFLQTRDWKSFARGYHGPSYGSYEGKLRQVYEEYASGARPDFVLREAQFHLTRLGFNPGLVDGFDSSRTKQAITEFQIQKGLAPDGLLGPKTRQLLRGGG